MQLQDSNREGSRCANIPNENLHAEGMLCIPWQRVIACRSHAILGSVQHHANTLPPSIRVGQQCFAAQCACIVHSVLWMCRSRQQQVLARKRREYLDMVPEFYDIENSQRTEEEIGALRQVGQ